MARYQITYRASVVRVYEVEAVCREAVEELTLRQMRLVSEKESGDGDYLGMEVYDEEFDEFVDVDDVE